MILDKKKSFSVSSFTYEGELVRDSLVGQFKAQAFRPIDDTQDVVSVGWATLEDPWGDLQVTELPGNGIALALRLDERRVSSNVLKSCCAKAEARMKAEKQVPKLSRGMRLEIKEAQLMNLLRKASPTSTICDVVIDLDRKTVILAGANTMMQAAFEDLWQETFGFAVTKVSPYAIMKQACAAEDLARVTPPPAAGEVLLDTVTSKLPLTLEFIRWIWFAFETQCAGDGVAGEVLPTMTLVGETEKMSCNSKGDLTLDEARLGLRRGKYPTKLTIRTDNWDITLQSPWLDFQKFVWRVRVTGENPVDTLVGVVLEIVEAQEMIAALTQQFVAHKIATHWDVNKATEEWINE